MTGPDRERLIEADLQKLGTAVVELYLQALNGVVCDPTSDDRVPCPACDHAWKMAREVLDRHDASWGNMFRSGPAFQLAALPAEPEQESPRFSTASTFRAPTDEEMDMWAAEDERWSKESAEPVRATDPVRAAAEKLIAEWDKTVGSGSANGVVWRAMSGLRAALAADREPTSSSLREAAEAMLAAFGTRGWAPHAESAIAGLRAALAADRESDDDRLPADYCDSCGRYLHPRVDDEGLSLLEAAEWVVSNWDRQNSQHPAMPALRGAIERAKADREPTEEGEKP